MFTEPYLATVTLFAGNFAPVNWHFCDGSLLAISQYEALFTLIGTTYGGDGVTTFAVPDLRGRVAIHPGSGYVQGQMAGTENVTMLGVNLPNHTHALLTAAGAMTGTAATGTSSNPTGNVPAKPTRDLYNTSADGEKMASFNVSGTLPLAGGSFPIPTLSPLLTLNYIIAVEGIYPSQG